MRKKPIVMTILLCSVFFITGITVGFLLKNKPQKIGFLKTDRREGGYKYINPLLECEYVDELGNSHIKNVEKKVDKIVSLHKSTDVSLYYRDLKNGPWFGINLDNHFAPQSLLKLPILFAYYKMAEKDPSILEDELLYDGQTMTSQNISTNEAIIPGNKYAVDYLIYRMIALSDNAAFEILALSISSDILKKVHADLGIPYPEETTQTDFITVRSYSSLFRVLYNASYLTRYYSNAALLKLIKAQYKNGLLAGVPDNIEIAHKFGVKQIKDRNLVELHDCGIVYHPRNPYILCIMTKGRSVQSQEKIISEISKTVYQEIDKK